eukprot:6532569-Prymnesium_polylepis.1
MYGHEHLETELVAAGAAPRSRSGRCRARSLALGGRAMRALDRQNGCSVGHFDDAPRFRVTAR